MILPRTRTNSNY